MLIIILIIYAYMLLTEVPKIYEKESKRFIIFYTSTFIISFLIMFYAAIVH